MIARIERKRFTVYKINVGGETYLFYIRISETISKKEILRTKVHCQQDKQENLLEHRSEFGTLPRFQKRTIYESLVHAGTFFLHKP